VFKSSPREESVFPPKGGFPAGFLFLALGGGFLKRLLGKRGFRTRSFGEKRLYSPGVELSNKFAPNGGVF